MQAAPTRVHLLRLTSIELRGLEAGRVTVHTGSALAAAAAEERQKSEEASPRQAMRRRLEELAWTGERQRTVGRRALPVTAAELTVLEQHPASVPVPSPAISLLPRPPL